MTDCQGIRYNYARSVGIRPGNSSRLKRSGTSTIVCHPSCSCPLPENSKVVVPAWRPADAGLLSIYMKVLKKSERLKRTAEKKRSPHTWPVKPSALLKRSAKTELTHCIIAERFALCAGLMSKWKWLPMMQKFSRRKEYLTLASCSTRRNSCFIMRLLNIISPLLTRVHTW